MLETESYVSRIRINNWLYTISLDSTLEILAKEDGKIKIWKLKETN